MYRDWTCEVYTVLCVKDMLLEKSHAKHPTFMNAAKIQKLCKIQEASNSSNCLIVHNSEVSLWVGNRHLGIANSLQCMQQLMLSHAYAS